MSKKRLLSFVALLAGAAAVALAVSSTGAGATTALPVSYDAGSNIINGFFHPDTSPPGANNWSCKPSASHPRAVVLVHGTSENENLNWTALSPLLVNHGYCVFALNYGGTGSLKGTGDIPTSAGELSAFIDRVLAATGTSKVDIVGHSQGGMMPRYYLKFLGGAAKVNQLVGLVPSNHGTDVGGLAGVFGPGIGGLLGTAGTQQITGSPFLTNLNAGGDTVPGVQYTVITTTHDEIVTPYTSALLTGANVTNIVIQQACPNDGVGHLGIADDQYALQLVLNALDPSSAATVACSNGFGL
ncbi:Triacylglycerol esterase/lipase EstA, alpha/beta hydrolase fold [Frankineae bacterium MT45]|nr:Triacylglycerol esterase/lipase EstA, alpha/beta hydrolase fold [Frankineae bacterium MT45]